MLAYETLRSDESDPIMRAWALFVFATQGFTGFVSTKKHGGWGFARTETARGMAGTTSKYLSRIDSLEDIHKRLMMAQIEDRDWRWILKTYDTTETLFYCDPPYVENTRAHFRYSHEMTDDDHRDLIRALLEIDGRCVISGYRHELYQPLEDAGWRRIEWKTSCHSIPKTRATGIRGKGQAKAKAPRTECLWLCPKTQKTNNLQQSSLELSSSDTSRLGQGS
jgi:DNA adenine methylase